MPGVGQLQRGSFAGRETYVYVDTKVYDTDDQTDEDAVWTLMERVRNVQIDDGPELSDAEYHGATRTGAIPGYSGFSGSFDYVRRLGTDTVFAFLKSAQAAGNEVMLRFMEGLMTVDGSTGREAPVLLGRFSETRDGNNDVVVSVPFQFVDTYDETGARVDVSDVTISIP